MKIVIISNRLPIRVVKKGESVEFTRSEGGLTTGLNSLDIEYEKHWIGWPGIEEPKSEKEKRYITQKLNSDNFHPVFLSKKDIREYYEGYSNSKIWPLCHYFYSLILHNDSHWERYKKVNQMFADISQEIIEEGDIVWIHDYQLMLLPALLRKKYNNISIGYFHHIPFPSYELFRVLPERAELLNGLLGADLIGFHTHEYMRHFISAVERVCDLNFDMDVVKLKERIVKVEALPMGINYNLYNSAILNPEIKERADLFKKRYKNQKIILSVDRLDYSKGIINRLKAFSQFLENNRSLRRKVSLFIILVPSRDKVDSYSELKTNIDQLIGNINGQYSDIDWTPIHYFYHGFSFEDLCAMYYVADIALVTPLRDGMNLVAKEYVATKRDSCGVLILSEMAGASIEMTDALIINPNDTSQIENAITDALIMSTEEKLSRLKKLQKRVSIQTVEKWFKDFFAELESIRYQNHLMYQKVINKEIEKQILRDYSNSINRLIVLDYDGTLSPFKPNPEEAYPSENLLSILSKLTQDPKNRVVISSGRDKETLEKWLGKLNIGMAAEHGVYYKENGEWHNNFTELKDWDNSITSILERFVQKTPRSSLEVKKTALVWHYRKVDAWLASIRERQLMDELITPCTKEHLQIMKGNKIIEIKQPEFTKGSEIRRLLAENKYDFILCMGDDITDEDMFKELPDSAYTIKIGGLSDNAKYTLLKQSDTLDLLSSIMVL